MVYMGEACSTYEEKRGVYRVLMWRPSGKRPLGRPRRRWECNITMDLQEVGFGGIDLFDLSQDRDSSPHLRMQLYMFRF